MLVGRVVHQDQALGSMIATEGAVDVRFLVFFAFFLLLISK